MQKLRYQNSATRRLYPLAALHSWMARPFSWALAGLRFSPNVVSLLSLLVSVAGLWLVATRQVAVGVALVYFGLILDHADGQVARRRGMGSTWGMYLDMAIDRVVEIGLILALMSAPPGLWPSWAPFASGPAAILAAATIGVMMLWRFLTAYNDVLFLRSHLMATRRLPAIDAAPARLIRRPIFPWVFNRDWVIVLWALGALAGQAQATILLLLALHALSCVEKMLVFSVRHRAPEGDASRILGPDYH